MSVVKYRFIEKIAAGMVTPIYNSAIAVGDKITDVFGKLQGLLNTRLNRAVLTTAWSGGASSTTDQTILTLVIAANQLQVGDIIQYDLRGTLTKPLSAGTTIQFWMKVNGTRTGAVQYTPTAGITTQPFTYRGTMVVRAIGASGVIIGLGNLNQMLTATTAITYSATGAAVTADTTANITLTMGIVFSNSNASNNVTANLGFIAET